MKGASIGLPGDALQPRATVKSISAAAGVSVSTVSRALNGDLRISAKTRECIAKIAQSARYVPNGLARGLSTRRTGVIALLLGEVTNPFYPEFLQRMTTRASERGTHLMLLPLGSLRVKVEVIRTMVEYGVDGCIVAAATLSDEASDAIADFRVPIVMINRSGSGRTCAVWCNNKAGGTAIGKFLVDRGHRHIAYAAGRSEVSDRERGLRTALSEAGIKLATRESGTYTHESGVEMATRILGGNRRIDAIVGANDIIALGVIDGARQMGVRVPQGLSVMGFDDIEIAGWSSYSLTTMTQPTEAMIDRSLDLLLARVADPSLPPEEILLPGKLRVRGSVRDLRAKRKAGARGR